MKVIIWGCRGSIASPGQSTLRYGGNSTCIEIQPREGGVIIVDAGSGIRLLGKKLLDDKSVNELCMILSHAHWDHLSGFPFFTPAYLSHFKINVYGGPKAQRSLKRYLSHQMDPPFFPVNFKLMKATFSFGYECPDTGEIGLIEFIPVPLSHPNGGYGFKFVKEGKTLVIITDNEIDYLHPDGLTREEYVEFCRNADVLIHDAQYTDEEYKIKRGWGHSTYTSATQLAIEAGVKEFCIFHHDPDRTDDDLDRQVEYCNTIVQKEGSSMQCYAAVEGMEISI